MTPILIKSPYSKGVWTWTVSSNTAFAYSDRWQRQRRRCEIIRTFVLRIRRSCLHVVSHTTINVVAPRCGDRHHLRKDAHVWQPSLFLCWWWWQRNRTIYNSSLRSQSSFPPLPSDRLHNPCQFSLQWPDCHTSSSRHHHLYATV